MHKIKDTIQYAEILFNKNKEISEQISDLIILERIRSACRRLGYLYREVEPANKEKISFFIKYRKNESRFIAVFLQKELAELIETIILLPIGPNYQLDKKLYEFDNIADYFDGRISSNDHDLIPKLNRLLELNFKENSSYNLIQLVEYVDRYKVSLLQTLQLISDVNLVKY